jgi:tRNA dimethylallyltransferase
MGPTASGKTQLAVELAQALQGEIISVDSALVYRGMDIGTAKPTQAERQGVPHHLIDIRDPAESYSAADFRQDVIRLAAEIQARGHRVILAGGTMLYFKALKDGIAAMPPANEAVRQAILEEANEKGWPYIHAQLQAVDPVAAARINPNDPQRLQRALEVYRVSGESLTSWQQQPTEGAPFPLTELAIVPPDRSEVHRRIEQRFAQMLAVGFEAEVARLFAREDLNDSLPAIKSVGYRQMWGYLSGEFDFDTMVAKALAATRQLAKRQFTWLRSWQDLRSLPVPSSSEALKILG